MAEDIKGQAFIADFFAGKDDGFLIDVGAQKGAEPSSMTWELLQRGWSGLLIEPLPSTFQALEKNCAGNPRVECIQVACSDEDGEADFYPFRGVSTLNKDWADACKNFWKHVHYQKPITVSKRRLDTLIRMRQVPAKIDFLQIDTEGHDLCVLKGMDWSREPSLICVETTDMTHLDRKRKGGRWSPNPAMHQYLRSVGYVLTLLTTGNGLYIRGKT